MGEGGNFFGTSSGRKKFTNKTPYQETQLFYTDAFCEQLAYKNPPLAGGKILFARGEECAVARWPAVVARGKAHERQHFG